MSGRIGYITKAFRDIQKYIIHVHVRIYSDSRSAEQTFVSNTINSKTDHITLETRNKIVDATNINKKFCLA